ncbi:heme oxygenase 1, chloroplastic-like protein [Tanacetum coccineum]
MYKKSRRYVLRTVLGTSNLYVILVKGSLSFLCLMVFSYFCDADAEFRNTGLERAGNYERSGMVQRRRSLYSSTFITWIDSSLYIDKLSKKGPQAFICHFYNTYFAHTAVGRMIGRKVVAKILNGKELEFYK